MIGDAREKVSPVDNQTSASIITIWLLWAEDLFFILVGIVNVILKKIGRNFALTPQELLVVFVMMIVASAMPCMGLSEYLLPIITAPFYYATAENNWANLIQPHIKPWMVLDRSWGSDYGFLDVYAL